MTDKTTIFLFAAFLIALWYRIKPSAPITTIGNITQTSAPSLGPSLNELAAAIGLFQNEPAPQSKSFTLSAAQLIGRFGSVDGAKQSYYVEQGSSPANTSGLYGIFYTLTPK